MRKILKLYKRRWGAETAYRKMGEFLPKTTSRSHVVRVFYFALAVLLYNVWSSSTPRPVNTSKS